MGTPQDIANAQAARSQAIVNLLALENAGPQAWADVSVDGTSMGFSRAKDQLNKSIEGYDKMIQRLSGPWLQKSYSR